MKERILRQGYSNDVHYHVKGNLSLFSLDGYTNLMTLPDNLFVEGNIHLTGCTSLTTLPNNLSVEGDIDLSNCTSLTTLPNNLSVKGSINLSNCTSLTTLPNNLSVEGDIDLSNCTSLTTLPNNLSVKGSINLSNCTSLTTLPNNLSVEGSINLSNCTSLTTLPNNLSVEGSINLSNCTSLTTLPNNFSVRGFLDLSGCTCLTTLPDNLSVGGGLNLSDCTSLTELPDNLCVGGDIHLTGCTSLTTLPDWITKIGRTSQGLIRHVFLDRCTSLTTLPNNFFVGVFLDLSGCTCLTALPENFSVRGSLFLNDCIYLTTLPDNLFVGGDLLLKRCTGLTCLPDNLFVAGNIHLTGCTSLTTLPDWITRIGRTSQGLIRHVFLDNTGLSDTLIDRLRTTRPPGIQFHFSRNAGQPEQQFSSMEQGFAFWRKLASSHLEMPELDLCHDQTTELVSFLSRLTSTADYQNRVTRPVLAQRVMALMSLLTVNERVREDALRHINQALSSCDDRIILALDDLETLQLRHSAEKLALENRDPQELRALGLKMMHLDEVKRIARDHMKSLSWVDEVEVVLAFQIGVRQQKLDLPGSTQHMLFRGCAYVSDQDIANAVQQVNTHCSGAKLEAYLLQWAPWQKFQRLQAVPSFDQLPPKTVARIDNCIICTEKTGEMVALGDTHLDYNTLVKAYMENGKNPLTNTPLDWSRVARLLEEGQ
ncbi:NEL-type E3 ubiquitin ligase domain-containing protein [Endozoicomonas sp. SCSIO W0465]|uniref:NEL-type E3 ubiquitin ligase domain-containing protein n=1 Tax=Endozoicomonas sp. SCSIO W0465 TaxID=2918516 RepID=UPI0020761E06|nr:NEL-type E3 ubiquitin ligase domain-containing protein [Endozoicomonas sp. SCSIO W0465]USE37114.1 hypothetical protein MJO57_02465 [Endozoicomonas sp. SCSIO W0465]